MKDKIFTGPVVAVLIAAGFISMLFWDSDSNSDSNSDRSGHNDGGSSEWFTSRYFTEAPLNREWTSDDYLIFKDGTVVSRETLRSVLQLDLSDILPMDEALCLSGKYVAMQNTDDNINVYDLTSGEITSSITLTPPKGAPVDMALSPCGKYLVYWSEGNSTAVYDMTTGEKMRDLNADYVSEFKFSACGGYIYKVEYQDAHSGWVSLYSIDDPAKDIDMNFCGRLCPIDNSGNFLVDIENDAVLDLSTGVWADVMIDAYFEFSDNGKYLAVETPGDLLRVYDTKSWEVVFEESYVSYSGTIFIDNDRYMLTCFYPEGDFNGSQLACLYDTSTWTLVNTMPLDSWIEDLQNLKGTIVYDPISSRVVDVLLSLEFDSPFDFESIDILYMDDFFMSVLLVNYEDMKKTTRFVEFARKDWNTYSNFTITPTTDVFVSENHDFLLCTEVGAYRLEYKEFLMFTVLF